MDPYEIRPEDSSCSWFHTRGTRLFSPCLFSSAAECAWMEVQKQERGWDKPGLRVEIFKRFFIVFPLNPLFSSAHIWLWLGTNVGVFTGINKTDGRSESCDAHNNTDPPSSSYCADYAAECPGWLSLLPAAPLPTQRITEAALRITCVMIILLRAQRKWQLSTAATVPAVSVLVHCNRDRLIDHWHVHALLARCTTRLERVHAHTPLHLRSLSLFQPVSTDWTLYMQLCHIQLVRHCSELTENTPMQRQLIQCVSDCAFQNKVLKIMSSIPIEVINSSNKHA